MRIELLADHPEVIPILTAWYQNEWPAYYGVEGPGDARADLESRCNYHSLPIGLIALSEQQVIGAAAIDKDMATDLTPSVVGLLVRADHRGQGVATALLNAILDYAKELRYSQLYLSSTLFGDYLQRSGWSTLNEVRFHNGETGWIYVRNVDQGS